MKIEIGKEVVITRGMRPEENPWGAYQFPIPYRTDSGIVVSVHVADDTFEEYGNRKWFLSKDGGETWTEVPCSVEEECGIVLRNGDRISFPMQKAVELKGYQMIDWKMLTPDYIFSEQAPEGVLPIQDGMSYWLDGTVIKAYRAERLPPSLSEKTWVVRRIPKGCSQALTEKAELDWKDLTRVVHTNTCPPTLKGLFPQGTVKTAPDGSVWVSTFSGEGHINPKTELYSPYYSAELFRSVDNCHSFYQLAHMEYEADGHTYPYQSGGFSDNDFEFMEDGSIVWFLRSTWALSTGREWDPMYFTRSTDGGITWDKPEVFAHTGIYPRLCKLGCGVVLICYARPGIFVRCCDDGKGLKWSEPLTVMTPEDRSALGNISVKKPNFHQWDGGCNNPTLIALDNTSALIFYSDFYYPDDMGVKRKTILCRKLTVRR